MTITEIDIIPYRIPYRSTHRIATLTLSALDNTVIRIRTDQGVEGVGETVSEGKWNSTVREAHTAVLRHYLAPALLGLDPLDLAGAWQRMDCVVNGHLSAKAGIDVALHDLVGKVLGIPVWRLLGGALRREIPVEGPGFGIGFMEPEAAANLAGTAASHGCGEIEIKCGHPSGWRYDLKVVEAVHKACGPTVSLKVDVTEAYNYKTALNVLPRMFEIGVEWVEQPLPRHALLDTARLRQLVPVGVMLEESVGHPADVLRIAQIGAADAIHLKLPMLGGFTMARRFAAVCEAGGLGIQAGSSTPSGIGLAAVHQFAAVTPNLVRGCHGSPLARAVDDLLAEPVDAFAPVVSITEAPGLGIQVDWAKVERYAVQ